MSGKRGRHSGPDLQGAGVVPVGKLLDGRTAESRTFIAGVIAGALLGAVLAGGQLLRVLGRPRR